MSDGTDDPAARARCFREGYLEGARAILAAIGDDLPEEQMRVLEKWVNGSMEQWRAADVDAGMPPLPMIDGA